MQYAVCYKLYVMSQSSTAFVEVVKPIFANSCKLNVLLVPDTKSYDMDDKLVCVCQFADCCIKLFVLQPAHHAQLYTAVAEVEVPITASSCKVTMSHNTETLGPMLWHG